MTYLLDTMTWFWYCERPEIISTKVLDRIETDPEKWALSAASVWEIARKSQLDPRNRGLDLRVPFRLWLEKALPSEDYVVLPITSDIATEANFLPGSFHRDPMDQLIVATARLESLTLVTSDTQIKRYPHVRTLYFKGPPPGGL
jgi:PIN domain nuclease of toxin-antitoxin system